MRFASVALDKLAADYEGLCMRTKSGLPKRKALRRMPVFEGGLRSNTLTADPFNAMPTTTCKPISVVSFFAGCGGLDLGAHGGFSFLGKHYPKQNFNIIAAYDNEPRAVETYRLNISEHAHLLDLTTIEMDRLPKADVLLGGFPCQDFSSCGHKRGFEGTRGRLYETMVSYMESHRPAIVIGENVPLLRGMQNGKLLDTIINDLSAVGYKVGYWYLNCPDFGLPASRKRIFIICVRNDIPGFPSQPAATHLMRHVSIDEAIEDLEDILDERVTNQSQYFVATKATAGAGQGDQVSKRGEVAYAVRANSKARVHFHYKLDRRLTVRELARLQSFPDEFVFPYASGPNVMLIGNAVPPIVGHAVMSAIQTFMSNLTAVSTRSLEFA